MLSQRPYWRRGLPALALVLYIVGVISCNSTSVSPPSKPIIGLSSQSLNFYAAAGGGNPARQTVLITNAGVDTLHFTLSHLRSWLDLVQVPGTNDDSLFVYAYVSGFSAGVYYDTITVTSDNAANSPQLIFVTATVQADIEVSPPLLQYATLVGGPDPIGQTLNVTSTGANGVSYAATATQPWLLLTGASGTTPGTVQVGISNSGLTSGTYRDTVNLATGSIVTPLLKVPVVLTVKSWALFTVSGSNDLRSVAILNDSTALAVGFIGNTAGHSGVILKTVDAGRTWVAKRYVDFTSLGGIDFTDELHGWTVGDSGKIMRTDDAGETWSTLNTDSLPTKDTASLWRVRFADRGHGWIVGPKGLLLKTSDTGRIWTKQTTNSPFSLADIEVTSPTSGWIVGNHGTILHTSDGDIWSAQDCPTSADLWAISMIDNLQGWIVGTNGIMLHTDNGGSSWEIRSSGETIDLNDVFFVDANTGWAVGDNGTIIRYQPATQSWWRQNSGTTRTLFNCEFTSNGYGVAVGELGTILATYNGGI